VDIVDAEGKLDNYKLLFAPSLNVIPKALADRLAAYVRNGGHLVLGPRAGMKDEFNRLNEERQPGPLAEVLGGRVEQFYALDESVSLSGEEGSGQASIWAERLAAKAPDVVVPLRYGKANGWLDGQPAVLTRRFGKGRITYLGALLDSGLMQRFVDTELRSAGVKPDLILPAGVELMTRQGSNRKITILVNHGTESRQIGLPDAMHDVLGDATVHSITLAPEGVAVLEQTGR
jgi:beta-galactosidase